jgi:hypothetical protein
VSNGHGPQAVTFTATVRAGSGAAQGTVTFSLGTTVLGTVPLDHAGQARLSTRLGATGKDIVTAVYNGDGATGVSAAAISAGSPAASTTELSCAAEVTRLETTVDLTEALPVDEPLPAPV